MSTAQSSKQPEEANDTEERDSHDYIAAAREDMKMRRDAAKQKYLAKFAGRTALKELRNTKRRSASEAYAADPEPAEMASPGIMPVRAKDSSRPQPESDTLLQSFGARKQPVEKRTKVNQTHASGLEYVGFGNANPSKEPDEHDHSPTEKTPSTSKSGMNSASTSAKVTEDTVIDEWTWSKIERLAGLMRIQARDNATPPTTTKRVTKMTLRNENIAALQSELSVEHIQQAMRMSTEEARAPDGGGVQNEQPEKKERHESVAAASQIGKVKQAKTGTSSEDKDRAISSVQITPPPNPSKAPATKPAKRPADSNHYADDRRASLSSLPKIRKRTKTESPHSPDVSDEQQLHAVGDEHPPRWYLGTETKKSRGKNEGSADGLLVRLRDQIRKCQSAGLNSTTPVPDQSATQLRDLLHHVIFHEVNAPLLKRHRMLHTADGLPQLFDREESLCGNMPFDIKADAHELYNKWCRKVFETDLYRGIRFILKTSDKKASGDSVMDEYKVPWNYHGNGDLLNGQWWPTQLCAFRDGAHGSSQAGISGSSGDGTYSVIMSGGHDYPDVDDGERVLYCGTDGTKDALTANTQLMIESVDGPPVRLIRSHNLESPFAPKYGFRYDGLYDVIDVEVLDSPGLRQHRFTLQRRSGQDPIRGGEGPERRPTDQEIKAYQDHQRLSGKGKGQA